MFIVADKPGLIFGHFVEDPQFLAHSLFSLLRLIGVE